LSTGLIDAKHIIINGMNIAQRYEIIDQIREGGMGEVFLGLDSQTGMVVAIKISKAEDDRNIDRFKRESEILKNLSHKNIVRFLDAGHWNDTHYIVMDYIAGKQIGSESTEAKALIGLLCDIVDSLSYLHSQGIVHRDVKPSNILVSDGKATLVDFGIAKVQNKDTISKAGTILGTLQYMAPEQVFGQEVDERSDLYSIGAVMYELFVGRPPFVAQNAVELIFKILSERPVDPATINPNIPDGLRNMILKLLEKDSTNRYQTAASLKADLKSFLDNSLKSQSKFLTVSPFYAPFVGRIKEIVQFDVMLDNLMTSGKQIMSISGKPGIGKSRLIEEFRSITLSKGQKFLVCDPNGAEPGKPAISTVLDQLASYGIHVEKALVNNYSFHIRELSPKLAAKLLLPTNRKPLDFVASLPDVIAQVIARAFKGEPFVIAFEENLDSFSTRVLTILSRIRSSHMGIIFVTRPEMPLAKQIQTNYKIELNPLSKEDLSSLARSVLGSKMSQDDLEIFEQKTGGNPLYALSILKQMLNQSTTITLAALPTDIAELFVKKISKLSQVSRTCLHKMTLLGKPLPIDRLRFFLDLTEFEMFRVSSELFKADLITEKLYGRELCLDIVSGVLGDLISTSMSEDDRKKMHLELAKAILHSVKNDQDPAVGEAGKHYMLAGEVSDGSKMVINASSSLLARKLHEQALGYLEYLAPVSQTLSPELLAHFWLNYLKSLFGVGKVEEASALIPEVTQILNYTGIPGNLKSEILIEFANISVSKLQFEDVRDYCLKSLFYTDSSTPFMLMADIFHLLSAAEWNLEDYNQSLEYSEKEKDYANRSGNKNKQVNAMIMNGIAMIGLKRNDLAKDEFQKAFSLAVETEYISGQLNAMNNLIEFDFNAEKYDEVVRKLKDVRSKAASVHDYCDYYSATMNQIMVLNTQGKLREMNDTCLEILRFYDETGCNIQVASIYDYMIRFSLNKMDLVNLEKYTRLMFDNAKRNKLIDYELSALLAIARLHYMKNDSDKAIMLLEKVLLAKKYAECPRIHEAYSQMCILATLCEDFDRAYVWFKDFSILVNQQENPDPYLSDCLFPKTLSFVLASHVYRKLNTPFQIPALDGQTKDGKPDYQKLLLMAKKAGTSANGGHTSMLDCYKPESVLGYVMLLNSLNQKKLFVDKHLVRDGLKLIEDTVYEMFSYDFKYLKDELAAVKFKLVTLLQN
jgi:serine/threonine protein kinase